jgi:hypothetical protein
VGGLLLAPRSSQTQAPGADPAVADPAGGAAGGDLSPRAADADEVVSMAPVQAPEAAPGALPGELSLADLFPSEAAMAAAPGGAPADGAAPIVQGGQVGDDTGRSTPSRVPFVAGLIVTLAMLIFGGGFLWWRNLDSKYWPC